MEIKLENLPSDSGGTTLEVIIRNIGPLSLELSETSQKYDRIERFKSNLSAEIFKENNYRILENYVDVCESFAGRGRLDGFADACLIRSTLKILDEEFLNWEKFDSQNRRDSFCENLDLIDEVLEEVSDNAPPVRDHDIPAWVDESHWWWWSPKRQDMTEEERYSRIHYEEL